TLAGTSGILNLSEADHSFLGEDGGDYADMVSTAGDVDGDGLADLLFGAYFADGSGSDAGKAYLFMSSNLGSTSSHSLSDADYAFGGEAEMDYAASYVSDCGDVDGDGLDDLLVGARANDEMGSNAGKAYVILGVSLGVTDSMALSDADHTLLGENADDYAGRSLSGAGDVDGDGLDDLVVGVPENDDVADKSGKACVVLGPSLTAATALSLADADYTFLGENADDVAGWSVDGDMDVDSDGLSDLLVSAHQNSETGEQAGKNYLVLGSSLGASATLSLSDADHAFTGASAGDFTGWSVGSAGDVNGDGRDDLLFGAYTSSDAGENAGKVHLLFSAL
ncbi:MAG: integrin alpha, partial [Myxococcota bacterium]|nr:integrin alpha [Myxococcota bacterium]